MSNSSKSLLDSSLRKLPVDLIEVVELSSTAASTIVYKNNIRTLVVTLLNEQDERISNNETKFDVLIILSNVIKASHNSKIAVRIILQNEDQWFDEIKTQTYTGRLGFNNIQDESLIAQTKLLFSQCWKCPKDLLNEVLSDKTMSLESCKQIILQNYGATQVQSIIRGFFSRLRLKRKLINERNQQILEAQQWSILIIQKIARGFITRKRLLRSMKIRKKLSAPVLRMAERYLQEGDLWGFLKEMDDELRRVNGQVSENEEREENWASHFVTHVVEHRQKEFNLAWDKFPAAVSQFKGVENSVGSLMQSRTDDRWDQPISASSLSQAPTDSSVTPKKRDTRKELSSPFSRKVVSSSLEENSSVDGISRISTTHTVAESNGVSRTSRNTKSKTEIGATSSVNPKIFPSGPLLRKALSLTVKEAVSKELDRIVKVDMRPRQLVQDIRDAYSQPPIPLPKLKSSMKASKSGQKNNVGKEKKPMGKKRKKRNLMGEIEDETTGKMNAFQSDWLSMNLTVHPTPTDTSLNKKLEPGQSILLDVPGGMEDTIERLLHAAALRCYVPPFFRGVETGEAPSNTQDKKKEKFNDQETSSSFQKGRIKRTEKHENNNEDPNYAYEMYLRLPLGLAKMRYELECQKWSQGPINKLKVKGLTTLHQVTPVSKFVMSLQSVETPKVLQHKAVELFVLLKNISNVAKGWNDVQTQKQLKTIPMGVKTRDELVSHFEEEEQEQDILAINSGVNDSESESSEKDADQRDKAELPSKLLLTLVQAGDEASLGRTRLNGSPSPKKKTFASPSEEFDELTGQPGWCYLDASVEQIMIQAAFLVIPYCSNKKELNTTEKTLPAEDHQQQETDQMGNQEFKRFAASLLELESENEKRKVLKARFRSSLALVAPYCAYLKTRGVTTVKHLLNVSLEDLHLPPAVNTQLEILLNVVTSRQVGAKILSVPRDHLSTAEELFSVPTTYDPKFQRSPFDPYGQPARLPPHMKWGDNRKSSNLRIKLSNQDAQKSARQRGLNDFHRIHPAVGLEVLQSDMNEPLGIWESSSLDQRSKENTVLSHLKELDSESDSEQHRLWRFVDSNTRSGQEDAPLQVGYSDEWSQFQASTLESTSYLQAKHKNEDMQSSQITWESGMDDDGVQQLYIASPKQEVNDRSRRKNRSHSSLNLTSRLPIIESKNRKESRSGERKKKGLNCGGNLVGEYMKEPLNSRIFKNTYTCTHPHCHQVFSRLYTYKIHLRSHQVFKQYHKFKRLPQLQLDADSSQIKLAHMEEFEEKIYLPVSIQRELNDIRSKAATF